MILINPQWQGGADTTTRDAALFIANEYLTKEDYRLVPTDLSRSGLVTENQIIGYSVIRRQTQQAYSILKDALPSRVFTIGGGCDADIASILYLNEYYHGNLSVLWFDSHGDINSERESDTHLFYGMPVRALLGECCGGSFPLRAVRWLKPDQIINIGGRDLDPAERSYMESAGIPRISTFDDKMPGRLMRELSMAGTSHIYIHFDLDVLDPREFPATPVPSPDGISIHLALETLRRLKRDCDVAGYGLFEYVPELDGGRKIRPFLAYGLSL